MDPDIILPQPDTPVRPNHLYHVGISGGKDSTAALLWLVYESGVPRELIRASFADTGNEHPTTLDQVRMLSEKVHPVEWLKPEMDFYELCKFKGRFPGAKTRFCTDWLKMRPSKAHMEKLLDENPDLDIIMVSGVRASESFERSRLPEFGFDNFYQAEVFRPLLKWSIDHVWAIHKKYGIAPNPLYSQGMARVGCFPCIFSRKLEIRNIALRFPWRIRELREKEAYVGAGRPAGYATFFRPNTVPERFRSLRYVKADGEVVMCCTIDDVVAWSMTKHGAKEIDPAVVRWRQEHPEGSEEHLTGCDDFACCPSTYGACE